MAEPHPPRNNMTTEMPSDIPFYHILPRLSVKSLVRFTCVSKQWHSFLRTPTPAFAKMHLRQVINDHNQNHHKLLVLSTTTPYTFCTIDCETPEDGFTPSRPLPFKVGPHQNMSMSFLTSLHGMVCVGIAKRSLVDAEYSDLILWNPVTGDYKTLSKPGFYKECYETCKGRYWLYYTYDGYKLVRVTHHPNIYIYSLKSDSWRKVESTEDVPPLPYWRSYHSEPSHVLLNGNLYFLQHVNRRTFTNHSYIILKFNTKTEELTTIATPHFGDGRTTCLSFGVLRGCIHFWVNKMDSGNELWRMERDGGWTKVGEFGPVLMSLWGHQPLHLMRNGNMLMHSETGNYVYKIDMNKRTIEKDIMSLYNTKNVEIFQGGKYMETIVSPNQYLHHTVHTRLN